MRSSLLIYLAIDNQFMRDGVEKLILSEFNAEAEINHLHTTAELADAQFRNQHEQAVFLFFECNKTNIINNTTLTSLHSKYPEMKKIVFIEKFKYQKIKTYFNLGVDAVMDMAISSEEFVKIMNSISNGDRSLASAFQGKVIRKFCEKENFHTKDFSLNENAEEIHVADGIFGLTPREKEVLELICNGSNTKEISEKLYISSHTAETHRRKLLQKMDVKNTAELVKVAIMTKLVLF